MLDRVCQKSAPTLARYSVDITRASPGLIPALQGVPKNETFRNLSVVII